MHLLRKQTGLSLVEVLVALAILSVGLLGTAALQIQAKRASLGSIERTTASMLVNDLFERMRANPSMFAAYRTAMDPTRDVGVAEDTEPSPDCESSNCDPAELAAHDVWEWEQALLGAAEQSGGDNLGGLVLPLACMDGPTDGSTGNYTVVINWRGHAELTGGSTDADDTCNAVASGRYDGDSGSGTLRRTIEVTSYLEAN